MRFSRWIPISLLALATACAPSGTGPVSTTPSEPLLIGAASDLQAVFPELQRAFTGRTGVELVPTFGASGRLAEQIRQGAPIDVFLCANRDYVRKLAEEGRIEPDSVAPYAIGPLVLAAHRGQAARVRTLDDLARPEVRHVAIANPDHAPYGAAARQALRNAGLWEALQAKLVFAETVRQAQQYVASGDADAGFLSGASAGESPEIVILPLDAGLHDPIVQCLGVARDTPRAAESRAFVRFLLSDEGGALLQAAGFRAPPKAEGAR